MTGSVYGGCDRYKSIVDLCGPSTLRGIHELTQTDAVDLCILTTLRYGMFSLLTVDVLQFISKMIENFVRSIFLF